MPICRHPNRTPPIIPQFYNRGCVVPLSIELVKMKLLQEEMLGITMAKYRKTQQLLEEAERRADRAGSVNVVRYSTTLVGGGVGGGGGRGAVTRSRAMSVQRETSSRRASYY